MSIRTIEGDPHRSPRRSVAGNAALLIAAQAATWCLGLLVAVALPRHLGPALTGQLHLALSLWAMAAVLVSAGAHTLLMKTFARDPGVGADSLWAAVALQVMAYVVAWAAVGALVALADYEPQAVVIIVIVGASIAFQILSGTARAAFYGLERMEFVAVSDVASKAVYVAGVLFLILIHANVYAIAAMSAVYTLVDGVLLTYFIRRLGVPIRLRRRGPTVVSVFRSSRTYLLAGLARTVYQQIDIVVMSLLISSTAVGWYSAADALFTSLLFLPVIVVTSLFPAFSRLHSSDQRALDAMLQRSFGVFAMFAVPIGLGTAAIGAPVSVLVFGGRFAGAGPVLAIMGLVSTLTYFTILLGKYALAIDRQDFWIRLMAGAIVLTIIIDLVLVPWTHAAFENGAIGGALSYLVTEAALMIVGVCKLAPGLLNRSTMMRVAKCATAGVVMFAAVWQLRWSFIVVPIAVGVVCYGVMLLVLRVPTADEVGMTRAAARRLLHRLSLWKPAARGVAG